MRDTITCLHRLFVPWRNKETISCVSSAIVPLVAYIIYKENGCTIMIYDFAVHQHYTRSVSRGVHFGTVQSADRVVFVDANPSVCTFGKLCVMCAL